MGPLHRDRNPPVKTQGYAPPMICWNVAIVAPPGRSQIALDLVQRLRRSWPGGDETDFAAFDLATIDARDLESSDAVILAGVDPDRAGLGLVEVLRDIGVPGLMLVEPGVGAPSDGLGDDLMVLDANTSEEILCGLLMGILHRQHEVRHLRAEVGLVRRLHGGLAGDIARIHEELESAATLQREYLPGELPAMHGVEGAAFWRPQGFLSGDYYDITRLDDDHLGFFLADAIGHGVPAGLMTMVICRALNDLASRSNDPATTSPGAVLQHINRALLHRNGSTARFATAVYAIVNCRTRRVRISGAGHPPAIIVSAGGIARRIDSLGGVLGVFPDETYEDVEFSLDEGDRLVLYSDGFEQVFGMSHEDDLVPEELFSRACLQAFRSLALQPTPKTMVDALAKRIDCEQPGTQQGDDLTMLCLYSSSNAIPAVNDRLPAYRRAC